MTKRQRTNPVPRGLVYEAVFASCGVCGERRDCAAHTARAGVEEVTAAGWRHTTEYGLVCLECHTAAAVLAKRRRQYGRKLEATA